MKKFTYIVIWFDRDTAISAQEQTFRTQDAAFSFIRTKMCAGLQCGIRREERK